MRNFLFTILSLSLTIVSFADPKSSHRDFRRNVDLPFTDNDVFTKSGAEIPWPMIVKPNWNLVSQRYGEDSIDGATETEFVEYDLIGLWEEVGSPENPKTFGVKVGKKEDGTPDSFEVILEFNGVKQGENRFWEGFGHFEDWTMSETLLERYDKEKMVNEKEHDKNGYYLLLDPFFGNGKRRFLRLTQVQGNSKEVFLGVSVFELEREVQSDHLLRRVENCDSVRNDLLKNMCMVGNEL